MVDLAASDRLGEAKADFKFKTKSGSINRSDASDATSSLSDFCQNIKYWENESLASLASSMSECALSGVMIFTVATLIDTCAADINSIKFTRVLGCHRPNIRQNRSSKQGDDNGKKLGFRKLHK